MTEVLSDADGMQIRRVAAPDARWFALLDAVRWGTNGLRYRLRDIPHLFEAWGDAAFIELVHGDELLAVFTLVPRAYVVSGFAFRGWYRTMLAVRDGTAGRGVGARIAKAVRERFLDAASEPTMLYGFIETDNERSLRLQQKLGYTAICRFEGTMLGWLLPSDCEAVGRATEADLPALRALWAGVRAGHVLDDLEQSLRLADLWVLRREGRPVAAVQASSKEMDIEALPGFDGKLLLLTSPLLRSISPFFAVAPHRTLWLGHAAWEAAPDWLALVQALQRRAGAASLLWYADPRGPQRQELGRLGLGPVHRLSPSPKLDVLAGFKGVPDDVIAALRERPVLLSPLDAS